jgi:hypothetical protein
MRQSLRDRFLMATLAVGLVTLVIAFTQVIAEEFFSRSPEEPEGAGQSPCPLGVIAWWNGSMAQEVAMDSVEGRVGLLGDTRVSPGRNGAKAFQFDGHNDFIQVATSNSNDLSHLRMLTMAAWIKAPPDSRYRGIVGKITPDEPRPGYLLNLTPDNLLRCDIVVDHEASRFAAAISQTPVADGQWHHVACSYDGMEVKVFVDGALQGLKRYTGGLAPNEAPMLIGKDPSSLGNRDFEGLIDEVAIFDRALTLVEFKALMNMRAEGCLAFRPSRLRSPR